MFSGVWLKPYQMETLGLCFIDKNVFTCIYVFIVFQLWDYSSSSSSSSWTSIIFIVISSYILKTSISSTCAQIGLDVCHDIYLSTMNTVHSNCKPSSLMSSYKYFPPPYHYISTGQHPIIPTLTFQTPESFYLPRYTTPAHFEHPKYCTEPHSAVHP